MKTEKIPVAELVEDFDLYPRHAVDSAHVAEIAAAYEAGHELPPLVAEQNHRLLDGFHRRRAFANVFGPQAEIEVVVEQHDSELSAFRRAAELNSGVGRKLDTQDRVRIVLKLRELGAETELIAATLHTTVERVEKLSVKVTKVGTRTVPVKRVAFRKDASGRRVPPTKLSKRQREVMKGSSGWSTAQTARQLTRELLVDLYDSGDPELLVVLWELHAAIEQVVPRPEQAVA